MEQLANITFGQIFGGIAILGFVISIFVEIAPVKVYPLRWLGKTMNGALFEEISNIKYEGAKRNAINCRVRILSFGDEIRRGVKHSKEFFDQILTDIDDYERYCIEHPEFKNNRTVLTIELIKETYKDCVENDKFL